MAFKIFLCHCFELCVYQFCPLPCVHTIGMQIRSEWYNKAIFFTMLSIRISTEDMMPLHRRCPGKITVVHIIRENTPQFFTHKFHSCFIRISSFGVAVSIPNSFASATVPSINADISFVSYVWLPR